VERDRPRKVDVSPCNISGRDFARTKKFRDVARTGRAAIVIDDVLPPWRPRGIEVRGDAEALVQPQEMVRIHPRHVVSWGLDGADRGGVQANTNAALSRASVPRREPELKF